MSTKRIVRVALALMVALMPSVLLAQTGVITGKADKSAKEPYADYSIQLRDASTEQVISTQTLNPQGRFSFSGVQLNRSLVVELVNVKESKMICSEGPYTLSSTKTTLNQVDVKCGKKAALWLLTAGLGTAAVVAVAVQSGSY